MAPGCNIYTSMIRMADAIGNQYEKEAVKRYPIP